MLSACSSTNNKNQTPVKKSAADTNQKIKTAENSGFGGTGEKVQLANKAKPTKSENLANNSGFGGTGMIGTITEFGSIWVNGIKVSYPKDVKIRSNLSTQPQLKVGQQVSFEMIRHKNLPWTESILVHYPLAGKIQKVSSGFIKVDGQNVFMDANTNIENGVKLKKGEFVAINGQQNLDGSWQARFIAVNPNKEHLLQPKPQMNFSSSVSKLLIHTPTHLVPYWDKMFAGLPITLIQNSSVKSRTYLLEADLKNGEIVSYQLKPYQAQGAAENR